MAKIPKDCMPMCKTCKFRVIPKGADGAFCHRYPPLPVTDEEGFGFTHVPVDDDDWCGQYERQCS